MKNEWCVKFSRESKPGRELAIGKRFQWGGKLRYIPSVYICDEGLVLDICTEIERETVQRFLERWEPRIEHGLSKQEQRQLRQEQPLTRDFNCHIFVNGEQIKNWHGSGYYWFPESLRPKTESFHDRTEGYLEHYGLDMEKVWSFQRTYYDWPDGPQEVHSLNGLLYMDHQDFVGEPFSMPAVGGKADILNPQTGATYTLTVREIQRESITIPERFAEYEMPSEATVMVYTLEPDLPHELFQLMDAQEADQARKKDGSTYNAGSVGMMLRLPKDGSHAAVSSMRFTAPETVQWEPVFRAKTVEDIAVELL